MCFSLLKEFDYWRDFLIHAYRLPLIRWACLCLNFARFGYHFRNKLLLGYSPSCQPSLHSASLRCPSLLGRVGCLHPAWKQKGCKISGPRQKPEVLAVLRERAVVQSVESSNRIEGVTIETNRLRPIVLGKARPRDRSEEELSGYRRALDWIFSRKGPVTITPMVIRKLHTFAQGRSGLSGGGDAGEWKKRNNEIIEISGLGAIQNGQLCR